MNRTIKILLTLFLIVSFYSCQNKNLNKEKPNIVLIVADDLGWSDLSFMGSKYYETPNIDRLSKSGILQMIVHQ